MAVLVMGMEFEQLGHGTDVVSERGGGYSIARISRSGGLDDCEQLGPDSLVDVAVQIEGHGRQSNGQVSVDGHGISSPQADDLGVSVLRPIMTSAWQPVFCRKDRTIILKDP